jgi:hypothetical protein
VSSVHCHLGDVDLERTTLQLVDVLREGVTHVLGTVRHLSLRYGQTGPWRSRRQQYRAPKYRSQKRILFRCSNRYPHRTPISRCPSYLSRSRQPNKNTRRDDVLKAAGYRIVRLSSKSMPEAAAAVRRPSLPHSQSRQPMDGEPANRCLAAPESIRLTRMSWSMRPCVLALCSRSPRRRTAELAHTDLFEHLLYRSGAPLPAARRRNSAAKHSAAAR